MIKKTIDIKTKAYYQLSFFTCKNNICYFFSYYLLKDKKLKETKKFKEFKNFGEAKKRLHSPVANSRGQSNCFLECLFKKNSLFTSKKNSKSDI